MIIYKSTTGYPVPMGRYSVTTDGLAFPHPVQELDDLLGITLMAENHPKDAGTVDTVEELSTILGQISYIDPVSGARLLSQIVISTDPPNDADGRPNGTIYLQAV